MITTDATVSKMEKMKKKKWWKEKTTEKSQKNCKTNLKIKTKNRSTPSKLRKDLKNPQSIWWRKKNTNTIVSGATKERKMKQKSSPIAPQISAREIEKRASHVQFVVLVWVLWFNYVRNPEALRGIASVIIRRSVGYLHGQFCHLFNFFNIETEITSYSFTTAPESCSEDSPVIRNSMLWPRTDFHPVPERDSIGPTKIGRYSVICVKNLEMINST